jgi:hypothetical protein
VKKYLQRHFNLSFSHFPLPAIYLAFKNATQNGKSAVTVFEHCGYRSDGLLTVSKMD